MDLLYSHRFSSPTYLNFLSFILVFSSWSSEGLNISIMYVDWKWIWQWWYWITIWCSCKTLCWLGSRNGHFFKYRSALDHVPAERCSWSYSMFNILLSYRGSFGKILYMIEYSSLLRWNLLSSAIRADLENINDRLTHAMGFTATNLPQILTRSQKCGLKIGLDGMPLILYVIPWNSYLFFFFYFHADITLRIFVCNCL